MTHASLKRPLPLKPGDKVALIAPSSPVHEDVLHRSVQSIEFLRLRPIVFPSCTMRHGYLSGLDHDRAKDVNSAFKDQEIKGIFCLRGGYGASRILPLLDYKMIRENMKVFVGYSDITAFHLAFNKLCGFITFHAPMPNTGYAAMDAFSLKSLSDNLFSDKPLGSVSNPPAEPIETITPGIACGIVTGGNLSLLQGTLGSPFEIDTRNKILFIEEVDEKPYRLDRALTALSLAGKFSDCAGIILGTFEGCDETDREDSLALHEIFNEVLGPFNKPTIHNFRAGHIYPQSTIPMGADIKLDASRGVLAFR